MALNDERQTDKLPTTPKQVAEWMVAQLATSDKLPQQETAYEIQDRFGAEFVCRDAQGELGIARKVLYQFRKLTGETVVWAVEQGNEPPELAWLRGYWRKREGKDGADRRQHS